jgi:hypothetical protein
MPTNLRLTVGQTEIVGSSLSRLSHKSVTAPNGTVLTEHKITQTTHQHRCRLLMTVLYGRLHMNAASLVC